MSSVSKYPTKAGERWKVRYRRPDGRWTDKRGFTRKVDAQAWQQQQAVAMRAGQWIDPARARATIGELGPGWLARRTHVAPTTRRVEEASWRLHVEPRWGRYRLDAITHTAVQEWVNTASSRTVAARNLGVLSGIVKDAIRDRITATNPCTEIRLPARSAQRRRFLTADELVRLADASKHPTLILVLGLMGLRWGEATELRVKDFNPLRKRLSISRSASRNGAVIEVGPTKSRRHRTLTVPAPLVTALNHAVCGKAPDDLIFPAADGRHMQLQNNSRNWFQGAVRRAGLERLTPHELRHTAASLAIDSGASVLAVQTMLGHASAVMTLDVYSDLFDSSQDALADRLGAVLEESRSKYEARAPESTVLGHRNAR